MTVDTAAREYLMLDRLRETYEHQGFEFFPEPLPQLLPPFLHGFRPDAIALKPGDNHIVEVKVGRRPGQEHRLEALAQLVAGHPGWQLKIFFENARPEDALRFSPPTQQQTATGISEVEDLASAGHRKAALLLAWSVLEAIARSHTISEAVAAQRPFSPAQTVQSLEMAGLVSSGTARTLREMAQLRNLAAHGDLGTDIEPSTVDELLTILRQLVDTIPTNQAAA